ncbi:aspartyl/asparaginyl beta-hydroxylase domain-containing protein [Sandarakinorhabdus glacialis]|nr:aspartyl/asparaginyl beta-hydroxylase domain-containing protein [Polymorphobacter glacialis]
MNDPAKARLEAIAHAGIAALRRRDGAAARPAFDEIVASGRASPQIWLMLAQACDLEDDRPAARSALAQVLAADPANLYALVMHGELLTRDGDDRAAVSWYARALSGASGAQGLPQDLLERLRRAEAEHAAASGRFMAKLQDSLAAAGVDDNTAGPRFAEALAIVSGQARPFLQEPTSFYFPGLPQRAFYDPADFAWTAALEEATSAITAEVAAILADRAGLQPYVERPKDRPAKAHSLLDDPRWSAYHLVRDGVPVAEHAARCPATMAAIAGLPIPVIAGASPMVLFSILAPGTHIQPHNGMLNTRLICHLPLVVPDNCRLRVGNTVRTVDAGKMLIFDDSIEHEAWNDSDAPRAILLFEIWRPELDDGERQALRAMFEATSH